MSAILAPRTLGSTFVLLLCARALCSALPADIVMNPEAGRGGQLNITIRLADGQQLPVLVDTGANATVLDKSLEPKLGKRLGKGLASGWGAKGTADLYAAPKLYLGNVPLMTGARVWTAGGDSKKTSGILGMDCLKHYCVQFDFQARTMRFLDSHHLDTANLGDAFPLIFKNNLPYIHHANLIDGTGANLLVDLGCHVDAMEPKTPFNGLGEFLPECVWNGQTYTNLSIAAVDHANVLGIGFLARHLVTLDFPNHVMYLKPITAGPLPDNNSGVGNREIAAPSEFLEGLKENGKLPGLSKDDCGRFFIESYSNFDSSLTNTQDAVYIRGYYNTRHRAVTFAFRKNSHSSVCHYTIVRVSKDSPWVFDHGWRTEPGSDVTHEFPF
jgi:hypothetical protein